MKRKKGKERDEADLQRERRAMSIWEKKEGENKLLKK